MSYTTVNFFRSCLCHIVDQNDDIVSTIMEKLKELDVGRCYLSQFLANLLNCLDDDSFDPSTRYFKELFYMCMDIDKKYNDTEPAPHPRNLTLIGKQKRMKYQLDYSLFESYPNTSFNQLAYRNEYITPEGYVYVDYDEYALGVALQIIKGNPYDVTHLTYNEIQNVSNVFKYFSLDVPSYIEESLKRIESASIKGERSSPPLGTNHCTPTDRGSQVPLCVYNELSRSSPSSMTNNNEANTVVTRHLHKEDYQRRKKHTMEDEDSEDLKSMNSNEGSAGTDNQLIEFNAPDEEDGAPERVTPADNLNSSKEQPCEQKPEIVNFSTSSVPSKKAFNQKYKERNNSTNGSARVIKQRMVFNMLAKQSSINSWMNSIIIDDRYNECLSNWVGHHNSWNLAYRYVLFSHSISRGSIHGFGAQHFHEACDNIGESLVLIRSYTENTTPTMGKQTYECIFGGYSKVGWVTKDFISMHQSLFFIG